MNVMSRSADFFTTRRVASGKPQRSWFGRFVDGPSLSDEEAFLAILIGAARADGVVSPEESQELAALTGRTKTLANLSVTRISELCRSIDGRFNREGQQNVLAAACHTVLSIKEGSDVARMRAESVFAHAVDLVFADREVNQMEQDYILELAKFLKIDFARGKEIVSVIEVKNAF